MVMYLLLHPKLSGGEFMDKTKRQVITRIDEVTAAKTACAGRTENPKDKKAETAAITNVLFIIIFSLRLRFERFL